MLQMQPPLPSVEGLLSAEGPFRANPASAACRGGSVRGRGRSSAVSAGAVPVGGGRGPTGGPAPGGLPCPAPLHLCKAAPFTTGLGGGTSSCRAVCCPSCRGSSNIIRSCGADIVVIRASAAGGHAAPLSVGAVAMCMGVSSGGVEGRCSAEALPAPSCAGSELQAHPGGHAALWSSLRWLGICLSSELCAVVTWASSAMLCVAACCPVQIWPKLWAGKG